MKILKDSTWLNVISFIPPLFENKKKNSVALLEIKLKQNGGTLKYGSVGSGFDRSAMLTWDANKRHGEAFLQQILSCSNFSAQSNQNQSKMARGLEGGWKGREMRQVTEWKQGKSVRGEHTGIGRGCRGPPQCSAVHEKTERRNKNRQHANSQQRDDRVKAYTQHGIMGAAVSEVCCAERRAGDGLETAKRSWLKDMQIDT